MKEPLVLAHGNCRWVLHPPVDPHGDGYVVHMRVESDDDGLSAATIRHLTAAVQVPGRSGSVDA